MKKVVVGMSGGVDSSVSAYLLKQEGYEVIGLFMKNWEEKNAEGVCQSTRDYEDTLRVCEKIGIPLYSVNFVEEYRERVFSGFIEDLKKGYTPNPDILCNREIKFDLFFAKAKALGADYLATGHYCRAEGDTLLKGIDPDKDQSYFLHAIDRSVLPEVLFPVGHLCKTKVREIAKEADLPVHAKKDSTGICFIGKRNFKPFIEKYIPYHPGNFENLEGKIIGQHDGAAYYTIGQRKGLGIGGPGDAWFVVDKDVEKNVVVIDQGQDSPALYASNLIAIESNFTPPSYPFGCTAKIRYRQEDQPCVIEKQEGDHLLISFDTPQRAITPRQSIVFYDGDICLGGALIEKPF